MIWQTISASQILRGDLGGALIPDADSQEIIQTLPQSSVLLTRARGCR